MQTEDLIKEVNLLKEEVAELRGKMDVYLKYNEQASVDLILLSNKDKIPKLTEHEKNFWENHTFKINDKIIKLTPEEKCFFSNRSKELGLDCQKKRTIDPNKTIPYRVR